MFRYKFPPYSSSHNPFLPFTFPVSSSLNYFRFSLSITAQTSLMKKIFTLLFLLLAASSAFAQAKNAGTVKGKLLDSLSKQNLKDATISILNSQDSSLIAYGLSKADGSFTIENVPFGSHIFYVTFQGFREIEKRFSINQDSLVFNPGTLYMTPLPADLGNVTVRTSPITIKGDTTEFNASMFATKPNSTAEDVLKKLPGVEVDKEGAVTAQGQAVTRVMVDGKRFFGDDPKMATRNIPTDMIDKIQLIDAQSDQSAFSGFDDGNREKVINITTKKDRRKGVFGRASAGAGGAIGNESNGPVANRMLYSNSLSLNRFNGDRQMSVIGQANNVNTQNFSLRDILSSSGGGGNRGGGLSGGGNRGGERSFGGGGNWGSANNQTGISRTLAGGLNYSDIWSKKTLANGSFFYNNVKTSNSSDRFQETFSPNDSSLFSTNKYVSNNLNKNYRGNFEIEHRFDSMNSLLIRPTFTSQETDNNNQTTTATTLGKLKPINDLTSYVTSHNTGYNFDNNILFRHKFARRGRTISLNLNQSLSNNDRTGTNITYNRRATGLDTTNRLSTTNRDGKTFGGNLSYTEPVGTNGQLELSYNYNNTQNNSNQQTYSLNRLNGEHDIIVPNLTNIFENQNISHRVSTSYRRQINKEWNYTVGMGVQHADLTSNNLTKKTYLSQSFNNLFPSLSFHYSKSRTKNLRFFYRGSTRQPSVSQLQDVIDNVTNVLRHTTGNPALKQEFSNSFNLSYANFNVTTFKNFLVSLNGGLVSNAISNYNIINATRDPVFLLIENDTLGPGAQFIKPINLNGAFNVSGFINYGFPLKNPKSNINLTTRLSFNRDVTLSRTITLTNTKGEDIRSLTNNYVLGETVRWTMNLRERFDLNFSSTSTFNLIRYTANKDQNGDYFTQALSVEPTYSTKSGWILGSDFDLRMNRGQSAGFNQTIPLLNASLSKLMLKNKRGELKFNVYDLLNQNKSITRTVDQNSIVDTRTQVLTRYFLLSFTYNLRSFKGGPQQNNRMRDMKDMFRGPDRESRGDEIRIRH